MYRLGGEAHGLVEQALVAVVRQHQRQGLAEGRRHARGLEARAHDLVHQGADIGVGQGVERLRQAARDLARDAPAVLRIGEPAGGTLGGTHGTQVGGDHLTRQEMILHEGPEDPADALLAGGHDRGVRDREPQGVTEQGGDGEPVREAADQRRFRRGAHVAEPRKLSLVQARPQEHHRREREQAGGLSLHRVELRLPDRIVRP